MVKWEVLPNILNQRKKNKKKTKRTGKQIPVLGKQSRVNPNK